MLVMGILAPASPSVVHGAIFHVPSDQPTIQAAINAASAGDFIQVSPGTYSERLVVNKPIHLVGASRENTIIDGQHMGTVVWVNSSNVEISGFTVRNPDDLGWGVHVERSNGVNITSNTVSASTRSDAVNLYRANNTLVDGNIFSFNLLAVNVTSSLLERITNNQAVLSNAIGVQLEDSSENLVFNNVFSGGQEGIDILQSSRNNVTRNLFKDNTIYGILVEPDFYNATASEFPQNNTIIENTFQRNRIGVNLQNATRNTFYHNDFFASTFRHVNPVAGSTGVVINSPNFWDNGTGFVSGNYWDDYAGTDADGDGIGDTPYSIGGNNQDLRPLWAPFLPVPVLVKAVQAIPSRGAAPLNVTLSGSVIGTLTPFSYVWDFGDGSVRGSGASLGHTFAQPGNFTVTLTVMDAAGGADSSTIRVEATAGVPGSRSPFPTVPVALGVVAVLGVLGFLFLWRRGRVKRRAGVKGRNLKRP